MALLVTQACRVSELPLGGWTQMKSWTHRVWLIFLHDGDVVQWRWAFHTCMHQILRQWLQSPHDLLYKLPGLVFQLFFFLKKCLVSDSFLWRAMLGQTFGRSVRSVDTPPHKEATEHMKTNEEQIYDHYLTWGTQGFIIGDHRTSCRLLRRWQRSHLHWWSERSSGEQNDPENVCVWPKKHIFILHNESAERNSFMILQHDNMESHRVSYTVSYESM